MAEMWAYCDPCGRSFYVPAGSDEQVARTQCPVCASEPTSVEMRSEAPVLEVALPEDANVSG